MHPSQRVHLNVGTSATAAAAAPPHAAASQRNTGSSGSGSNAVGMMLTRASLARRKGFNGKFSRGVNNSKHQQQASGSNSEDYFSAAELMQHTRHTKDIPEVLSPRARSPVDDDMQHLLGGTDSCSQPDRSQDSLTRDRMHERDRGRDRMHEKLRVPDHNREQAAVAAMALQAANLEHISALSTAATTLSPTFPDRVFGSAVNNKQFDRKNLFHGADDAHPVDPMVPSPSTAEHIQPGDAGTPPMPAHMQQKPSSRSKTTTKAAGRGNRGGSTSSFTVKTKGRDASGSSNVSFSAAVRDHIARQPPGSGSRMVAPGEDVGDTVFSPSVSIDDEDLDNLSQTSSVMFWDAPDTPSRIRTSPSASRGASRNPSLSPKTQKANAPQSLGDSSAHTPPNPPNPPKGHGSLPSGTGSISGAHSSVHSQSLASGSSPPFADPGHSAAWNSSASFAGAPPGANEGYRNPCFRQNDSQGDSKGASSSARQANDFTFGVPMSQFRKHPAAAAHAHMGRDSAEEAHTVEWWANVGQSTGRGGHSAGSPTSRATVVSAEPPSTAYSRVDPIRRQLIGQVSSQGRVCMVSRTSSSAASTSGGQSSKLAVIPPSLEAPRPDAALLQPSGGGGGAVAGVSGSDGSATESRKVAESQMAAVSRMISAGIPLPMHGDESQVSEDQSLLTQVRFLSSCSLFLFSLLSGCCALIE